MEGNGISSNSSLMFMFVGALAVLIIIIILRTRWQMNKAADGNEHIRWGKKMEGSSKYKEAMDCYLRAERMFGKKNDDDGRARAWCQAGLLELKRGFPREALVYFRKAEPLAREASSPESYGFILINMGDAEKEAGNRQKARKYYLEAEAVYKEDEDEMGLMFVQDKLEE